MIPPIFALLSWPVVSAVMMNSLRIPLAIAVSVVAGYLLLPDQFAIDLPLLPPFDKHTIPSLSVVVLSLVFLSKLRNFPQLKGLLPRYWLVRLLLILVVCGTAGTVLTNTDRVPTFTSSLPALRPYDGFSMVLNACMLLLPFLIGRKFFYQQNMHRLLLMVICIGACIYSLLALYEIRMSPQLSRMVYGFFPHSWLQHVRGDGFRPLVFMKHGLELALFMCLAILAAAGMFRLGKAYRWALPVTVWLLAVLVMCKSLGALIIALLFLPIVFLLNVRLQLLAAAVFGIAVLTYPMLRSANLVPIDSIMSFAANIDADRAASLQTRLDNEDRMLERALERPVFGWGGYGRSRVRDELGRDITIADGYWTIILGIGGWVRYIGEFGLLALPALLLFLRRGALGVEPEAAVLALMLSATLIDAIPNSGISPVTWLIVGALWGRLELGRPDHGTPQKQNTTPDRTGPTYTRDFNTTGGPGRGRKNIGGRYTHSRKQLYPTQKQIDIS